MGVRLAVDDLIAGLETGSHGVALAEMAQALATLIDLDGEDATCEACGEVAVPGRPSVRDVTAAVKELRATLVELIGVKDAGSSGGEPADGWGIIGSVPDPPKVRDAPKPKSGDARARSSGGRKTAG